MRLLTVIALLLATAGCSSINIQTGPPTVEEQKQHSSERGKGLRSEFANQLNSASPIMKARMVKQFTDSISARFIDFGYIVADEWQNREVQSGSPLSGATVRQWVDKMVERDRPVLDSYDDILEYGLDQIRLTERFDTRTLELFTKQREMYYEMCSAVFYPNGTREDYEDRLHAVEASVNQVSRDLTTDLSRY
ncbi:MAG: hypothetical protein KKA42_11230 [candidate division Zixibacteria bacterium]|nr:hypothetical protein [candidate division Zixibacteria bacterium]